MALPCSSPGSIGTNTTARAPPELTEDVIGIILAYAQRVEHNHPLSTLSTLASIRSLLANGLVSRMWHGAITTPSLWAEFLDAGMKEDQFLRVVERSGDIPVEIRFKALPESTTGTAISIEASLLHVEPHNLEPLKKLEYIVDDSSALQLTASKVDIIIQQMHRVYALQLDLTHATVVDKQGLRKILRAPAPKIHTLSVVLNEAARMDPTREHEKLFGGEAPFIRHLQLVECHIGPPARCHSLTSLALGIRDLSRVAPRLHQWFNIISRGGVPKLKTFTIHGTGVGSRNFRLGGALHHPWKKIGVPSTLERVVVEGQITVCNYLLKILLVPATVDVQIKVTPYTPGRLDLSNLMANIKPMLQGPYSAEEISLRVGKGGLIVEIATCERSVALNFAVTTGSDPGCMFSQVLKSFNSTEGILPDIHDNTWLELDLDMWEEDFMDQIDPYGFQQHNMRDYVPEIRSFIRLHSGIRCLRLQRSSIHTGDSDTQGTEYWADPVGLFRRPAGGNYQEVLLPCCRHVKVALPSHRSEDFDRDITQYAWDRRNASDYPAQSLILECLEYSPDLPVKDGGGTQFLDLRQCVTEEGDLEAFRRRYERLMSGPRRISS